MPNDDLVLLRFFIEPCEGGFAIGIQSDGEDRYYPKAFRTRRAALRAAKDLAKDLYAFAREHGVEPLPVIKQ